MPSVATFSPGRTTKQVADLRAGRSGSGCSLPSAQAATTSLAPSSSSARERRSRAALRPRLEVAAGEDERRDDRCDLEVDLRRRPAVREGTSSNVIVMPGHAGVEEEQGDHSDQPQRREGADARSACPSSRRRAAGSSRRPVERPAGPEHDRRREREGEPLPVVNCSAGIIAISSTGTERTTEKISRCRSAAVGSASATASVLSACGSRAVYPTCSTASMRRGRRHLGRVVLDGSPLGRVVHGGGDALELVQLALDAGGARGTRHPLDRQLQALRGKDAHRPTSTVNGAVCTTPSTLNWRNRR